MMRSLQPRTFATQCASVWVWGFGFRGLGGLGGLGCRWGRISDQGLSLRKVHFGVMERMFRRETLNPIDPEPST